MHRNPTYNLMHIRHVVPLDVCLRGTKDEKPVRVYHPVAMHTVPIEGRRDQERIW
jgi:hypothetical protein